MCISACLLILGWLGSTGADPNVWSRKYFAPRECNVCVSGADYCDSSWLPALNLNLALAGVDIAKKHPMPISPQGDPSFKYNLFQATYENTAFGNMEPYAFLHLTDNLVCSADFESNAWMTFEEYIHGSSSSSMSGWNLGYEGPTVSGSIGIPDIGDIKISMPPNTASYENGHGESSAEMHQFFSAEGGSVSHSEVHCSVYDAQIDIEDPSLALHPSLIQGIKDIDLAKSPQEKDQAMTTFIDKFGSHYAKSSIMGIGVIFETRYTEEETFNHDIQTLNECSSSSGGFKLFGFGTTHTHKKCTGSLEDTTSGKNTVVKRFRNITYGTPPAGSGSLSEWGDMVQDMLKKGTLSPIPVRHDLRLILDIFGTPTVANIEHSPGHKVDVKNIFSTALDGYSKYCSNTAGCDVPACAYNVLVSGIKSNGIIFRQDPESQYGGRPSYKNSENNYFMYFEKDDDWIISEGGYDNKLFKTSPCPQRNVEFQQVTYAIGNGPLPEEVENWNECSRKCLTLSNCHFWQHNINTKKCSLIADYSTTKATSAGVSTGTRDCPGDKSLQAYGQCVENTMSRSMWQKQGRDMFEKDITVVAFDPDFLIIAGGEASNKVEFIGKKFCDVPNLPDVNKGGNMVLTSGDLQLLNCFGRDKNGMESDLCYSLDVSSTSWFEHSRLTNNRYYSTAITMPDGVYILGGFYSGETSDFLPQFKRNWQRGPQLHYDFTSGCGVKISDTEFALIGGYSSAKYVVTYNVETGSWTGRQDLFEERIGHSCALHPPSASIDSAYIIVAGGQRSPSTTEIIPVKSWVPEKAGNLKEGRHSHSMVTVGGKYPRVYAIGGFAGSLLEESTGALSSVELWDGVKKEWNTSPKSLNAGRYDFGALAVPNPAVCMTE